MGWLNKFMHRIGMGYSQRDDKTRQNSTSVSDIQTSSDWGGFASDSFVDGLEFGATLQLRTPLRVLTKHREIHKDRESPPPNYAKEGWEGIWLPKIDSKFDALSEGATMASEIGPVPLDGGDYLPYLISVRTVVESELPIEERRNKLKLLDKSSGSALADHFFPPFITSIKGLSKDTISELHQANLNTPDAVEKTSDEILLKINGIGPSKLKKIRETCSSSTDKNCEWVESAFALTR
jgi:hypothetical protein